MEMFNPIERSQLVDREYQNSIHAYLINNDFPWYFTEDTKTERFNTPDKSTPSFGSIIYDNGCEHNPHFEFFKPLIAAIESQFNVKITELMRISADFLFNTKYPLPSMPYKHNAPQRDYQTEHFTVCYYVNETDGETVVYRETEAAEKHYPMHKCMPEKGKALMFNGLNFYANTCPKVHTKRIVLTINFTGEKL